MSASTLRIVYKAKASSLLPSSSNTAKNYISNGKKTPKFYSSSFFVIVIFGLSNNVKFMFIKWSSPYLFAIFGIKNWKKLVSI